MSDQKIIDLDTNRAIKKMNREELQAFLVRYADGLLENDDKTIDLWEVEKTSGRSKASVISVLRKLWL